MPYSAASGIYTPAAGATSATAGQTIQSATWDSIHSDFSTALTTLGQAVTPVLSNGNKVFSFVTAAQTVNFSAAAGDVANFPINLPNTTTNYRVVGMQIISTGGNLSTATVSLYTAPFASGTVVIGSTALTVTTSVPNTSNSAQIMVPASPVSVVWNATNLYLHITTSVTTAGTGLVAIEYRPYF